MEDWEERYLVTCERALAFLEIGHTYRIVYSKGNLNNKRIHVRALVDSYQVVYRQWFRRKQYWNYKCESLYALGLDLEAGFLKHVGKTKEKK